MITETLEKQVLMRIYIGEKDRYEHRPLYEVLVEFLHGQGIAGATVLRGVCGFGGSRAMHSQKILDLSADLPLVVEVVDTEGKLEPLMAHIQVMLSGNGLITLEQVNVVRPA